MYMWRVRMRDVRMCGCLGSVISDSIYVDKVADSLSLVATIRNSIYRKNEGGCLGSVSRFRRGENGIGLRRIRNSIYINT